MAITAAGRDAGAEARVGVDCVAIITRFADLNDPITTGRRDAVVAVIRRVIVTVITALKGVDDPVATKRDLAVRNALIRVVIITIIACFIAWLVRAQVSPHQAVTADRRYAPTNAGIRVAVVAIITGFIIGFTFG